MEPSELGPEEEEQVQLFCDLGLTPIQGRVFIGLVGSKELSARTIVESLGINRVDVYRALQHLQGIGLVETSIGNPNKYVAISPDLALKLLVEKAEKHLSSLKSKAEYLRESLASSSKSRITAPESASFQFYKLKSGRAVVDAVLKMEERAHKEIRKIVNSKAMNFHLLSGITDVETKLLDSGVRIRLVTDSQSPSFEKYSKIAEIRYDSDLAEILRYIIIDDELIIISLGEGAMPPVDSAGLMTNNKTLVNALANHFEELWSSSKS